MNKIMLRKITVNIKMLLKIKFKGKSRRINQII